jgi:ABC-type Fe3+ transport system permease subunit
MHQYRWLRALAKGFLRLILLVPVVAILLAVLVDRGPSGTPRLSLFPLALVALDPFAWTCLRNSLIFATISSFAALILGVGLGWIVARRRFWGRTALYGAVAALSAAAPAFLALGVLGLLGPPYGWPWPFSTGSQGASLESWRGLTLWVVWFWTSLPGGVALVMLTTVSSVERLSASWEDAARLAGAGPFRAWRDVSWPLVRPFAARAAALVFSLALVEPGAPLVLGLRRTIAFQIVDSATRPDPFPRLAIWAVMAGLIAWTGWILIRRWGGAGILSNRGNDSVKAGASRPIRRTSFFRAVGSSFLLGSWVILGWLPMLGLVRLATGDAWNSGPAVAGAIRGLPVLLRHLGEPPLPQFAFNSLLLGLEVVLVLMVLAWLVGTEAHSSSVRTGWMRWEQLLTLMPPLVQGVGVLSLSWLAGLAAGLSVDRESWRQIAIACEKFSQFTNVDRNPWILLIGSVGLALVGAVLKSGHRTFDLELSHSKAAFDAARLAGASKLRARALSIPRQRRRWLGLFILIWALGATNLSPALLFTPWTDGRTVTPGVLVLADGPGEARAQAAALALCVVAVNLAALAVARLTSALPRADS